MSITFEWPTINTSRTFKNLTQIQVNRLVSYTSRLQDIEGEVPVRIVVEND